MFVAKEINFTIHIFIKNTVTAYSVLVGHRFLPVEAVCFNMCIVPLKCFKAI